MMNILGIETSCDETAASIVTENRKILSNVVKSQNEHHAPYGGVVPEIAARAHLVIVEAVVRQAIKEAKLDFSDLDGVAATCGPGLIGGVIVGSMVGKAISAARKIPFVAANHLEGHALTARLTHNIQFPYLVLLLSGGHSQFIIVEEVGEYQIIGNTIDDALGEAFDKVAKMLGIGFPGGPAVEKMASFGSPGRFNLPRPLRGRENSDFSFSGLKTSVRNKIEQSKNGTFSEKDIQDLCSDFQYAVSDVIKDRVLNALNIFSKKYPNCEKLVLCGGVASNQMIRTTLEQSVQTLGVNLVAPPINLCTDNGAMIAWVGVERLKLGLSNTLDFKPRPRWSLEEL